MGVSDRSSSILSNKGRWGAEEEEMLPVFYSRKIRSETRFKYLPH